MDLRTRCTAVVLAIATIALPAAAFGAGQFKNLLNKVKQSTQHADSSQLGHNLPASDIAAGLKEALAKGTTNQRDQQPRPQWRFLE